MHKPNNNSDLGKFRMALLLSGFFEEAEGSIFNDRAAKTRRLKLWNANAVWDCPDKQLFLLVGWLTNLFGERFIEHDFIDRFYYGQLMQDQKSLCIRLAL